MNVQLNQLETVDQFRSFDNKEDDDQVLWSNHKTFNRFPTHQSELIHRDCRIRLKESSIHKTFNLLGTDFCPNLIKFCTKKEEAYAEKYLLKGDILVVIVFYWQEITNERTKPKTITEMWNRSKVSYIMQWKSLNVITLGQTKSDNSYHMITITNDFYLVIFSNSDDEIWSH